MSFKYLDENGLLYFWQKLKNTFVAKESGKGLSENNYTTAEKDKLAGIASGAEVNVQSDWSTSSTTADSYIKNKPNLATVATSGDYSDLSGKPSYDPQTDGRGAPGNTTYIWSIDQVNGGIRPYYRTFSTRYQDETFPSGGIAALAIHDLIIDLQGGVNVPYPSQEHYLKHFDMLNDSTIIPVYGTVASTYSSTGTSAVDGQAVKAALDAFVASPHFTGTPTAPNAAAGTNSSQIATTSFVNTAIASAVGQITGLSFEVVTSLPTTGSAGVIYLIAHTHGTLDIYDEYVWLASSSTYEKIGTTDVDLSGYVQTSDLVAITNTEIDNIIATGS